MRRILLVAAAALALGGCQSAAEKQAAATGEIHATDVDSAQVTRLMKAAREKTALKPGLWRLQIAIQSAELGDVSPDVRAAQDEAIRKQARDTTACRTEKELKPLDLEQLEKAAGTCRFARYELAGGRIDADITCKKEGAPATHIRAAGTSSPTGFDILLSQQNGLKGQPGYLAFKVQATGKRLGECAAAG